MIFVRITYDITHEHAKKIGAKFQGTKEINLATLMRSQTVTAPLYKVLFTLREGLQERVYPVTCLGVERITYKKGIGQSLCLEFWYGFLFLHQYLAHHINDTLQHLCHPKIQYPHCTANT